MNNRDQIEILHQKNLSSEQQRNIAHEIYIKEFSETPVFQRMNSGDQASARRGESLTIHPIKTV